jgi:putative ABC transport system permease protein
MAIPYEDVKRHLTKLLLANHHTDKEDALGIFSYLEGVVEINKMVRGLNIFLGGVGLVTLLIGGIGVANVMFVSVAQRTTEIGVRRAIGARRSDVFLQFVSEALIICAGGGLIGVVAAVLISKVMGLLPLPQFFAAPKVAGPLLLLIFGFIVGAGIISGVFPARKAAASNVIESLHYE